MSPHSKHRIIQLLLMVGLSSTSTVQHFEYGNVIETCNGIIFDFYTGLSHVLFTFFSVVESGNVYMTLVCQFISHSLLFLRTWSNLALVHENTFSYMRTLKGTYLMMTNYHMSIVPYRHCMFCYWTTLMFVRHCEYEERPIWKRLNYRGFWKLAAFTGTKVHLKDWQLQGTW